jgi:hypothetical protein
LTTAKDLRVAVIRSADANALIRKLHYSHKVVHNSQLHLGVFLGTRLEGAMQFGPPLDRRKLITLVSGTPWNGFLELNRLAFSDNLPRNSESRALSVALRMIRAQYPQIQWIVSFADGTLCGDGTIYRASGFVLTGLRANTTLWTGPSGDVITNVGSRTSLAAIQKFSQVAAGVYKGGASMTHFRAAGYRPLSGFQLRYLFFIDPTARARLTVPVIPFSRIRTAGASMYRGQRASVGSIPVETAASPRGRGRFDSDPDAPDSSSDQFLGEAP